MRPVPRLGLAVALLALALPAQAAQQLADVTLMTYSPGHGTQVEYYDKGHHTFLWYPGNKVVVPGEWKMAGKNLCFRYGPNTYNPVTGARGAVWECMPEKLAHQTVVDMAKGDVFGLSQRARVPFSLPARRTTIKALAKRLR